MQDLIFISMEDWDDVWRRNQFVCAELARRHPEMKILFVGLPVNVSNRVRRGRLGELAGRKTRKAPGFENITLTHPLKLLPNSLPVARRVNELMFRRHVRRVAEWLGMREPTLWLNPHYAVHMLGRMGERGVVYDITDDWTTITQSPSATRLVREQDEVLCRRADATIVCSERLYELKQGRCRSLHLVPNGVDAEHYRPVLDGEGPLPEAARAWERPVLGYTGTIHPDRVDVDLVEAVAKGLAKGTVVMIGPDFLSAGERVRLEATGRVALPGPVPYAELPQYMRAFDVCITPHRVTPFTESLNPIKLWEYLAAGKPIVATDVAGFRDYPDWVTIAMGSRAFTAAVLSALGEHPTRGFERRQQATEHSWSSRVAVIEGLLIEIREQRAAAEASP